MLEEWEFEVIVWDEAPSHRTKSLDNLKTTWVFVPSYSLELNPAESV